MKASDLFLQDYPAFMPAVRQWAKEYGDTGEYKQMIARLCAITGYREAKVQRLTEELLQYEDLMETLRQEVV